MLLASIYQLKTLLISIFILSLTRLVALEGEEVVRDFSNPFSLSRLDLINTLGESVGTYKSSTSLGIFMPIYFKNSHVLFFDCRGYQLNHSKKGFSCGFGAREHLVSHHIIGANLYYDYLQGSFYKSFHRVGFGLEPHFPEKLYLGFTRNLNI